MTTSETDLLGAAGSKKCRYTTNSNSGDHEDRNYVVEFDITDLLRPDLTMKQVKIADRRGRPLATLAGRGTWSGGQGRGS